jgi:GxxExxY protein
MTTVRRTEGTKQYSQRKVERKERMAANGWWNGGNGWRPTDGGTEGTDGGQPMVEWKERYNTANGWWNGRNGWRPTDGGMEGAIQYSQRMVERKERMAANGWWNGKSVFSGAAMNTQNKFVKTEFDELTYEIIGCAMASHTCLGPSLREDSYQRDMETRLAEKKISFDSQQLYEVMGGANRDILIGYYIPDLVVGGKVVVEIKALPGISNKHVAQVIGYLAVTVCPLGLLINFGEKRLQFRRIFPPLKLQDHLVNHDWLFVPEWLRPQKGIE